MGNVFLNEKEDDERPKRFAIDGKVEDEKLISKLLQVSLNAIGGMIAAKLADSMKKKKKRKNNL